KPGPGWEPQMEELTFSQQPGSDQRPYDRLIGAALDGERWVFARQYTVEAAWTIVDAVLGDAVPDHPYAGASPGPKETDRLLPDRVIWHNPAGGTTSRPYRTKSSGRVMAATSCSRV